MQTTKSFFYKREKWTYACFIPKEQLHSTYQKTFHLLITCCLEYMHLAFQYLASH